MDTNNQTTQILVAFDFSDSSEIALKHAINLATEGYQREFHFLVALDPHKGLGLKSKETVDFQYTEEIQKLALDRITALIKSSEHSTEFKMMVHVRIGDAAEQILSLAQEIGASLIIIGSHGKTGIKKLFLGSVSGAVVPKALCPVFVARARSYQDMERMKIVDTKDSEHTDYVPPHRYHYTSSTPTRNKAWALY